MRGDSVTCYRPSYYRVNNQPLPKCLPQDKPTVKIDTKYNSDKTISVTAQYTLESTEPIPQGIAPTSILRGGGVVVETDRFSQPQARYERLQPIGTPPYTISTKGRTISITGIYKPTNAAARYRASVEYHYAFPFDGERAETVFDYPPTEVARQIQVITGQVVPGKGNGIDFGDVALNTYTDQDEIDLAPICANSAVRCRLPALIAESKIPKGFAAFSTDPNNKGEGYFDEETGIATMNVYAKTGEKAGRYAGTLVIKTAKTKSVLANIPLAINVVEPETVESVSIRVQDKNSIRPVGEKEEIILSKKSSLTFLAKALLGNGNVDSAKIKWSVDIPPKLQSAITSRTMPNGVLVLNASEAISEENQMSIQAQYGEDAVKAARLVVWIKPQLPCTGNDISIVYKGGETDGSLSDAFTPANFILPTSLSLVGVMKKTSGQDCYLETGRINNKPYVTISVALQGDKGQINLPQRTLFKEDGSETFSTNIAGSITKLSKDDAEPFFKKNTPKTLHIAVLDAEGNTRAKTAIPARFNGKLKSSFDEVVQLHQAIKEFLAQGPVETIEQENFNDANGATVVAQLVQESNGTQKIIVNNAALIAQ